MRLFYALLVVLFAISVQAQQTTPASNRVKQHSGSDKKVSTTLAPQQASATDKGQPQSATRQGNDKQPPISIPDLPPVTIKKDSWDKAYICFTFLLVIVGGLTLTAIWYQAVQTRRAAEAAEASAKAIQQQTGLLEQSIVIAEENSAAAKANAEAANRNAEALINSERAWVTAVLIFSADLPDPPTNTRVTQASLVDGKTGRARENLHFDVCLTCRNDGHTPAWISDVRIHCRNFADIPSFPDFVQEDGDYIVPESQPIAPGKDWKLRCDMQCPGPQTVKNTLLIYGCIKYRDVIVPERETHFVYYVRGQELLRLSLPKYWEYNKFT